MIECNVNELSKSYVQISTLCTVGNFNKGGYAYEGN
ncbi:hypothetical protein EDC18_102233 [Natranaerovirga pectinivora]|uniref:Uncharacterized protein n=1 Tax=Natranaerovirga pectinivora TaxID=682400 RepID=A0A4R3MQP4_9FIRM|nr:hypothetical protein EDC18_102233 [Natranaerovirga pectinivora]